MYIKNQWAAVSVCAHTWKKALYLTISDVDSIKYWGLVHQVQIKQNAEYYNCVKYLLQNVKFICLFVKYTILLQKHKTCHINYYYQTSTKG